MLTLARNTSEDSQSYGVVAAATTAYHGTQEVTYLLRVGPNETADGSLQISAGDVDVVVPSVLFISQDYPEHLAISLALPEPGQEITELLNASTAALGGVLATNPLGIKVQVAEKELSMELPAPMNFTLKVADVMDARPVECAYWDQQLGAWSSKGVSTLPLVGGAVQCSTTHLSFFAAIARAILMTLICSNAAGIFSLEGLQSLLQGQWAAEPPAVVQWITLLVGACLLLLSRAMDKRHLEHIDALESFEHIKLLRPTDSSRRVRNLMQDPGLLW